MTDEPIVRADDLKKTYGHGHAAVEALKGVDLSLNPGEFVAVMGPSGSGKSTLMHLLGGLDRSTGGTVRLHEDVLEEMSDWRLSMARRRQVGFIFQFFNLMPTLAAEENVALPLIIDGVPVREYRAKVERMLELVGLCERRTHKPDELSGGEQQRVAIARALITDPAVILADEPTGNLDTKTGTAILELLRHSCRELRQTFVMVTHDVKAASYADRVVFLRDGEIIDELNMDGGGEPEAILARLKKLGI